MGKFRSKLKSHTKGKKWLRGHSATTNPTNQKHRSKAKGRFFQANLSLAKNNEDKGSLTTDALSKHEVMFHNYEKENADPTINEIAMSLKSYQIGEDDEMTQTQGTTFKSYRTFASDYSSCTNMSFNKLLTRFRDDNPQHKEMLAILAGITEIIKEKGGTQSSTEYFLGLLQVLESAKDDNHKVAALSLLTMGIKTVPEPVLRKKFSETGQLLFELMEYFAEKEDQSAWKHLLFCMGVLLRNQEYSSWSSSSTQKYFDSVLMFSVHSRPKIRKSAQQAVASILRGSTFMLPASDDDGQSVRKAVKFHPMSSKLTKFCIDQFKVENVANLQTVVLHTLGLLQSVIGVLKPEDLKGICENLLSIMTTSNILIRTNCFQTLHSLFLCDTQNLNAVLIGKLITALYDYQPDVMDSKQTLAWLTVIKQGLICLGKLDLILCSKGLVKFVDIITKELWSSSDKPEIVSGCSNAIRDILNECVQPCVEEEVVEIHRPFINKVIESITKTLTGTPFGTFAQQLMICLKFVFKICGAQFKGILKEPLVTLGSLYDAQSSLRIQIEHVVAAAIESMGPEEVLQAIPLAEANGVMSLSRSWILPLLRESIRSAKLEFFGNHILKLAADCRSKWRKYSDEQNVPIAHTYELLCCQLWGLFPGFCRTPVDPYSFKFIAQLLGKVLTENAELRAPIFDGLKELCTEPSEAQANELAKFAKNFLPILLNLYTTKPTTSYEAELRESTLDVIKCYLPHSPPLVRSQLFDKALEQLQNEEVEKFLAEGLFDVVRLLAIYQSGDQLTDLFKKYLSVVIKKEKKNKFVAKGENGFAKQQKKAYLFFQEIIENEEQPGCLEFVAKNKAAIKKLLLNSFTTTSSLSQNLRLKCLKRIFELQKNLKIDSELITRAIPECVLAFGSLENSKENVADELIKSIAELYKKEDRLNEFVDLLMSGFAGDTILIANTLLVLRNVLIHFTGDLTVQTLDFVLDQVLQFVPVKQRNEAEAAVSFVLIYVKVLPVPVVGRGLDKIVKALSAMVQDTKRYCRIKLGFIYKKLCKKFTPQVVITLVPGNDEGTHKRLKAIKKEMARKKRAKQESGKRDQHDGLEDMEEEMDRRTQTIDEILADSDSDSDFDNTTKKEKKSSRKSGKEQNTYIKEDADTIVDLADLNDIGKVTTTKPTEKTEPKMKKAKEPNRGFKTADDGRLIIDFKEDNIGDDDSSEDDEDDDDEEKMDKKVKEDSSSDEEVEMKPVSRKRKASEAMSMNSGKSGASSKYQAGGKGIHRNVAGSMKSGYSGRMSSASTKASGATFGSEFKSKKAKGDVKKGKVDPYAYIPLNKNTLNKRKRAKNAGQFKSIVTSARKGAAAGSKNRLLKINKNQK